MCKIYRLISLVTINIFFIITLVSCAGIKAGTHYDESYYFDGYKTFSWISEQPITKDEKSNIKISPLSLKKIVETVQAELQSKGYQYVADIDHADFGLSYTVGSRKEFAMDAYPIEYRHDWHWYWHGNAHTSNQWHIQSWTEGTLTIDIFDNSNKEPIWHGWATKTVTSSDRKDPTESISKAVSKIFNEFPFRK